MLITDGQSSTNRLVRYQTNGFIGWTQKSINALIYLYLYYVILTYLLLVKKYRSMIKNIIVTYAKSISRDDSDK